MISIASSVEQIIAPFDTQLGLGEQRNELSGGKVLGNKNTASECDTGTWMTASIDMLPWL